MKTTLIAKSRREDFQEFMDLEILSIESQHGIIRDIKFTTDEQGFYALIIWEIK